MNIIPKKTSFGYEENYKCEKIISVIQEFSKVQNKRKRKERKLFIRKRKGHSYR